MTDFDKLAILDRYGFRLSSRYTFAREAPQAARKCFHTIPGKFAIWAIESGEGGWAVVGDDAAELIEATIDGHLIDSDQTEPAPRNRPPFRPYSFGIPKGNSASNRATAVQHDRNKHRRDGND